jgi:putative pyruvate formate lyase activating enzyme
MMSQQYIPGYVTLFKHGELEKRVLIAYSHLSVCDVCALKCPVDRLSGKLGACRIGEKAKISIFTPHHGEESPISGWRGSGTIFFTRCNLKCQYCQNHEISQTDSGFEVNPEEISEIMLKLQSYGCHNINFVSPSHVVPQILAAIQIAANAGLHIPLVYNSGGYDSLPILRLLDGVIDIYMPDMKYSNSDLARIYSKIPHYTEVNRSVIKEMHRQVGDLQIDSDGIALRGLLIRHLILPVNIAGTDDTVKFIANEISKDSYLNIMDQYHPAYHAHRFPELNRMITMEECREAFQVAINAGLHRFDKYNIRLD